MLIPYAKNTSLTSPHPSNPTCAGKHVWRHALLRSKGSSKKSRMSNKAMESEEDDNKDKTAQSPVKLCKNKFGTNNISNTQLND